MADTGWSKDVADAIWERDNSICIYCGQPAFVIDHVVPVSRGGPTSKSNGVLACQSCNLRKGGRIIESMSRTAFRHLLTHGEKLSWLDVALAGSGYSIGYSSVAEDEDDEGFIDETDSIIDEKPVTNISKPHDDVSSEDIAKKLCIESKCSLEIILKQWQSGILTWDIHYKPSNIQHSYPNENPTIEQIRDRLIEEKQCWLCRRATARQIIDDIKKMVPSAKSEIIYQDEIG